ncbi:hypothetical protein T484DRAFT_1894832, partial [Baffinella frigidus]
MPWRRSCSALMRRRARRCLQARRSQALSSGPLSRLSRPLPLPMTRWPLSSRPPSRLSRPLPLPMTRWPLSSRPRSRLSRTLPLQMTRTKRRRSHTMRRFFARGWATSLRSRRSTQRCARMPPCARTAASVCVSSNSPLLLL